MSKVYVLNNRGRFFGSERYIHTGDEIEELRTKQWAYMHKYEQKGGRLIDKEDKLNQDTRRLDE